MGEEENEEKGVYEVLDDVFALIEQGFHRTPKFAAGKLYLYNELGENKVIDLSSFSKEEQKMIHEKARKYAKQVRDELRRLEKQEKAEQSEEKEEKKKEKRTRESHYQQAGTGRKITLEALDRSHAKLVQNITERVSWFADVLNEIGFYATLIAMQQAKVPPDELYDRIIDFRDPQEFADFVREHLVALLEAKEEAQTIMEYRKKLDVMDAKLAMLEEIIEQLKQQRDQATIALYAAVSTMDEDQLRNFVLNLMVSQYGLSVKLPSVQIPNNINMNVGGVEVEAGRADGEGVSEEEGNS